MNAPDADGPGPLTRARRFVMAHERGVATAWVALCLVVLGVLGVWGVALNGAERVVDERNARWTERVDVVAALVRAGKYEAAADVAEALDREFPAVFVKHRLDRERERLLGLLGEASVALDRKARALGAYERRVDFDPRNWRNHYELARAHEHFEEPGAALESYARVLAIHPTHLPSVTAVVTGAAEAGRHAEAVAAFEAYLDAWLLAPVTLRAGAFMRELEVQVDGRPHEIEVPLELRPGWTGTVCFDTNGYSGRIDELVLVPAAVVGEPARGSSTSIPAASGWRPSGATDAGGGRFSAASPRSSVCRSVLPIEAPTARMLVRITLFKTLSPELWELVRASYRNALQFEGLAAVSERVVVGGCPEAGSEFDL